MTIDDFTPEQIAEVFDRVVQDFYNDFVCASDKTLHKHATVNANRMEAMADTALEWKTWQLAIIQGLLHGFHSDMPVDFCLGIFSKQCVEMGIRIGLELAKHDAPTEIN